MTDKPTDWGDFSEDRNDEFGLWDAECYACEIFTRVNDMGLCEECAGKLERDFIRKREWSYSALAFACPKDKLEILRAEVVRNYGERLELLAGEEKSSKRERRGRKGRGKR
jgi:hypothetical protein